MTLHFHRELWEFIESASDIINHVTQTIRNQGEKISTILKAPPSKRYKTSQETMIIYDYIITMIWRGENQSFPS